MPREVTSESRVLVLGGMPEIVEAVVQELVDFGIAAEGSADAVAAPGRFDARAFDLISFGGGLRGAPEEGLKRAFLRQNPKIRFLDTWAPLAVRQIIDALEGRAAPVDLDAYCLRIGYGGPRTPTLATLQALQEQHIQAIPFEALDVMLDRGVDIGAAAIEAKLIGRRRGGYCFEQNGLFKRVLDAMGFAVEGLIARVRWMAPAGAPLGPRTHMVLRVTLDGVPWLADVGFGGCVPPAPLRMDHAAPQPTRHETFRLLPFGSGLLLQAQIEARWMPLYDFAAEPATAADFELGNWFTSAHPASHFRHRLMVARTTLEARLSLLGNRLSMRGADGTLERRSLEAGALEETLAGLFGLPVEPDWRPLLARIATAD